MTTTAELTPSWREAPILLSESRDAHGQSHNIPGAVLVTSGLVDRRLHRGAVLLVTFAIREQQQHEPLVPFSIFKLQTLTAANVATFVMGTRWPRYS